MPDKYIFADEAGCMTFENKANVSRYFIVCTVAMDDLSVAMKLMELRKSLVWDQHELGEYFHATTDKQAVRDAVFATLVGCDFTIQAQILEKAKAQPQTRTSPSRFYQYGWYFLFRFGTRFQIPETHRAVITAATIGQRRERAAFRDAIDDVMRQTVQCESWITDHQPAASDPCLQVADYCAWALQRKYERGDTRSYDLIRDKITYEVDVWKHGQTKWY